MTVLDLFMILPDYQKVLFITKHVDSVRQGLVKNIPSSYFDYIIDSIYSLSIAGSSYIVINFA